MAESETVVGNGALHKLGAGSILTFDDEDDRARALNARFGPIRDLTLRAHRWTFAMKRARLSAEVTAPAFDYTLSYVIPADCLQLVQINGAEFTPGLSDNVARFLPTYQLEGGKILTDIAAPLDVRYVCRQETTTLWDALFDEALACRLAFDLCEKITGSTSKKQVAWQEYQAAIREAFRVNAIEQASEEAPDGSWLVSRW